MVDLTKGTTRPLLDNTGIVIPREAVISLRTPLIEGMIRRIENDPITAPLVWAYDLPDARR
jgi:hypothetical protein